MPIFYDFALLFCLILLLQIFEYIFSIFMHFVCANISGAIVLKPRFKIDACSSSYMKYCNYY